MYVLGFLVMVAFVLMGVFNFYTDRRIANDLIEDIRRFKTL